MHPAPTAAMLTPFGLRLGRRRLPCSIGRGGLRREKAEGDGATPCAELRLVATLYRPDRLAPPAPWARPIRPGDLWSDDPARSYNRPVRAPFAGRHEALRRADRLYDIVLVTSWNLENPVPGRGSAIFVHRWRRPGFPTEGCIGLAPEDLRWLAARAAPGMALCIQPLAPKMAEPTRT